MKNVQIVTTNPNALGILRSRVQQGAILLLIVIGLISADTSAKKPLYLIDKASLFILDIETFEKEIRKMSAKLEIEPEWLMAVIFNESGFDPHVKNHKGSGATGLIQFMPKTAPDVGTTVEKLGEMTAVTQLKYVYKYLRQVKNRGPYDDITDLYLGVLYQRALQHRYDPLTWTYKEGKKVNSWKVSPEDSSYVLYANPSQKYKQNQSLDENKDGRVSVDDIDKRMKRLYPIAYAAGREPTPEELLSIIKEATIEAKEDVAYELTAHDTPKEAFTHLRAYGQTLLDEADRQERELHIASKQ